MVIAKKWIQGQGQLDNLVEAVSAGQNFRSIITGSGGGGFGVRAVSRIFNLLGPYNKFPFKFEIIPAIRQVGTPRSEYNFSGSGLISKLSELQNPTFTKQPLKNGGTQRNFMI